MPVNHPSPSPPLSLRFVKIHFTPPPFFPFFLYFSSNLFCDFLLASIILFDSHRWFFSSRKKVLEEMEWRDFFLFCRNFCFFVDRTKGILQLVLLGGENKGKREFFFFQSPPFKKIEFEYPSSTWLASN